MVIGKRLLLRATVLGGCVTIAASPTWATAFHFSTGAVSNAIATASRPGPSFGADAETESADDFILANDTRLTSASFVGLLPAGVSLSSVDSVGVEVYRTFPTDSDVGRTSGSPTFSTSQAPTRSNSPSDVAFASRDSSAAGGLGFSAKLLSGSFTAINSVDLGINPTPNQMTGGNGPVSGQEVQFDITLTTPLDLPANHYFFVPQVLLADPNQHFLWLSAERPVVTGTLFAQDLQAWIRNARLEPDWLRVGTDIVGSSSFNLAFTLDGQSTPSVPEPGIWSMIVLGFGLVGAALRRKKHASPVSGPFVAS